MRKLTLIPFMAAAVLSIAFSCAKIEPENTKHLELMAFDAWVLKYVNENVENKNAVRQSNGIYVEFFADGDQTIKSSKDTIVWLRMNYTAKDLYGNVFVTRDSLQALRQRTFTPHTNYTPDYLLCGKENYNMIDGQYFALQQEELTKPDGSTMYLSEGSKVRLYIPSSLAFGSSGYSDKQGYGGQYALSTTKAIIEDLEIVEVIKNPIRREELLVNDYARNKWGFAEKDTLATCFYVDTLNFRTKLSQPFDEKYKLTADSTVKIWYVKKLISRPGELEFIFETNIDSVYNRFYNRRALDGHSAQTKKMAVMSYKPEDDKDKNVSAFFKAIPNLRKGQWSRILFTSAYGYGATGFSAALQAQTDYYNYYLSTMMNSSSNGGYGNDYYGNYGNSYNNYVNYDYGSSSNKDEVITEIQPYTPLMFEIYIESGDEKEQ